MRVLVTGGTGLIGRALIDSLLADGHRAAVLTRSPDADHGLPSPVEKVRWDAETLGEWVEVLGKSDAVVHLAGENVAGLWTGKKKERIRDSRVLSTRAVATAIRASSTRPRVLIQASAVGYYGDHGDQPITEETPPGDHFLGRVGREWEGESSEVEGLGVRRALLRSGLVMAREGGILPIMALPFRLFVGGRLGSGKQWVPWIHIADQVGAIRFLLEHQDAAGPFNSAAPNPVTNLELSKTLGRVLRRPAFVPAPAFVIRAVARELGELALMSQRAIPARLQELGYRFRFPDLAPAFKDLFQRL